MLNRRFLSLVLAALFGLFIAACSSEPEQRSCSSLADCEQGQRCDESGVCSSTVKSCETGLECAADEYCGGNTCQPAACSDDATCADGNICVFDTCREGCRPGDSTCGEGESCNANTFLCEPAGCTLTSCRPRFQRCDETQSPAVCVFTGACDSDYHCLAYGNQLNDGKEYICNQARNECVEKPPCTGDDDCRIGEICSENVQGELSCRAGCRSGSDCRIGELCAIDQGSVCVKGCSNDEQCQVDGDPRAFYCRNLQCVPTCASVDDCSVEGQVCSGSPSFCQGCTDDAQCRSTQFCDFASGATPEEAAHPNIGLCKDAPPTCPDDGFGENTSREKAHVIDAFPFEATGEGAAYFCRENTSGDWFAIDVAAGQYIEIDLDYDQQGGNLDVILLRADGSEIVASAYPPNVDLGSEKIRYGVDLGARMYVQVRGAVLAPNVAYSLRVNVGDAPACTGDAFDPNTRDEPADLSVATTHRNLRVCGSEPDYYKISVSDNQVVRITAQAPVNLGYINLALYKMNGELITSSDSRRGAETLYHSTSLAEDFIVEVTIVNNVGDVGYSLEWISNDNQCSDAYEPNDSCNTAARLQAGLFDSLNVCIDADYYKISLTPFQRLTVTATYAPSSAAGELDIFLFGPNDCLTLIGSGEEGPGPSPSTVSDTLTYQASRGGEFYLLASIFQGLHVPYSLDVKIEAGPLCEDDRFVGNSSVDSAQPISRAGVLDQTESAQMGLKICDESEDWFSIELQEGDQLQWDVRFNHAQGDIDAYLIGPDKTTVLDQAIAENVDESLSYTVGAGEAGTYYLKVVGAYAVRMEYRVLTYLNGIGPELPACPDRFGSNESRDKAAAVEPGMHDGLIVCGNPNLPKWFKVPMKAGETIDVGLGFSKAKGRINLKLYNGEGGLEKQSNSNQDSQHVSFKSPQDQTVFIEVSTLNTVAWNTYDMTIAVSGAEVCVDDRFAGNHSLGDAESVDSPGIYTRMRICDNANDWFKVDLVKDQKFEAFIRFEHSKADFDLYLWGPDASAADPLTAPPVVVGSSKSTTNTESVILTPKYTAAHYLEVRPKAPARADYDMLLFRDVNGDGTLEGTPDRNCPDQFENNDSLAAARQISPGSYKDLSVCSLSAASKDWDFYKVFVPGGATLTVDLQFVHADGNIDLQVTRGNDANNVVSSKSVTDNETVTITNNGAGETYIVQVYGTGMANNSRNYYDMDVLLEYDDVCVNPVIAGLDKVTAKTLGASAHENLQLCEGTQHWYKLELLSGDELVAKMDLNSRFGDIEIELLDSNQTVVANDPRSANLKGVEYDVAVSGTYYLRIFTRDGAYLRGSYDLWLELNGVKPERPYCPDVYERNDSLEMAAPLVLKNVKQSQHTDMLACGVEQDWYQVTGLAGNTDYEVAVFTEAGAALNLALTVQSADGTVLSEVPAANGDRILKFKTPSVQGSAVAAPVFIGVVNSGVASGQGQYSLHIVKDDEAYDAVKCIDDEFEPNNDEFTSQVLPSSIPLRIGLTACKNSDYFEWTALKSGTTHIYALFNNQRLNLGMTVEDTDNYDAVVRDRGTVQGDNRAGGEFQAVAGRTYLINIGRSGITGVPGVPDGPYFLHITQP